MCQSVQAVATSIANGSSVQFDTDGSFDNALAPLRQALTPLDIRRFRQLGHDCSYILSHVSRTHVRPGLTEWAIGAAISQACVARGIDMVFLLKAADDRVDAIRHPLPTTNVLHHKAMLVLCGRRGGLIASLTRMDGITPNQAFYWNPSIAGTKSEDTVLLVEGGGRIEVLTADGDWPQVRHTMGEITYSLPDVLHIQVDAAGNPLPK
ncbi:hypothetical protein B5M09_013996 [Aphanomyces astaci]|uniref:Uncharacterized protein n=1 Tax=Aphanomyces astaci TaxID=112090 RepID=A0A3R7WEL9_APHAT|nr:hypothetical protein B5M09_013996 [Aphanomyces astaci]